MTKSLHRSRKLLATVLGGTALAFGTTAALPSGHEAGPISGPPAAEAHMIPFPGWWVEKVQCSEGGVFQQAGLCGEQEIA